MAEILESPIMKMIYIKFPKTAPLPVTRDRVALGSEFLVLICDREQRAGKALNFRNPKIQKVSKNGKLAATAREVEIVRPFGVFRRKRKRPREYNSGVYALNTISAILSSFGVILPPRLLIRLEVRSAIRPPSPPSDILTRDA